MSFTECKEIFTISYKAYRSYYKKKRKPSNETQMQCSTPRWQLTAVTRHLIKVHSRTQKISDSDSEESEDYSERNDSEDQNEINSTEASTGLKKLLMNLYQWNDKYYLLQIRQEKIRLPMFYHILLIHYPIQFCLRRLHHQQQNENENYIYPGKELLDRAIRSNEF